MTSSPSGGASPFPPQYKSPPPPPDLSLTLHRLNASYKWNDNLNLLPRNSVSERVLKTPYPTVRPVVACPRLSNILSMRVSSFGKLPRRWSKDNLGPKIFFPYLAMTLTSPNAQHASIYTPSCIRCGSESEDAPKTTIFNCISHYSVSKAVHYSSHPQLRCPSRFCEHLHILYPKNTTRSVRWATHGESADTGAYAVVCQPVCSAFANNPGR